MTTATAVGFMLCAVLGCCISVMWWSAYNRLDDHEQRLSNLEIIVAGWLPEEVAELDVEPITDEIPVVLPETVPELRTVERTVRGFTFRVREEAA